MTITEHPEPCTVYAQPAEPEATAPPFVPCVVELDGEVAEPALPEVELAPAVEQHVGQAQPVRTELAVTGNGELAGLGGTLLVLGAVLVAVSHHFQRRVTSQ